MTALIGLVLGLLFASLGCSSLIRCLGGAWSKQPEELALGLSPSARSLVERALEDLDPARLFDYHVHVAGHAEGGADCRVNPAVLSLLHPWRKLRFAIFMSAAGVDDLERGDAYVERLARLVRGIVPHGRHALLAMDRYHRADGSANEDCTEIYVPNEFVWSLAQKDPELFAPVISVHPYRADALEELDRWGALGVHLVKWLPNAMGIDPSDPRCDAFYERMRHWNMALLSHAGDEQAVEVCAVQRLGNLLLLRRALDRGLKVIVAHCASSGEGEDLDDRSRKRLPNFDLFLRLMDEPRYQGRVFGEISALAQVNREPRVLATMLERTDLHARLVNGSDYPLPVINSLFSTRRLVREGFLTPEERAALNEIYDYNPLLFDLVLKRTLHHPKTGQRFPARVFLVHPDIPP